MDQKSEKNEMFTDEEKFVLGALQKEYKWIARDKDGSIYVYADKPQRGELVFKFQDGYKPTLYHNINIFKHIFKGVTWENSPICFRKPILNDVERRYLKTVFRPFYKRIISIRKEEVNDVNLAYLFVWLEKNYNRDDYMVLPVFDKRKMYKGMKFGKKYTLEELGITYD